MGCAQFILLVFLASSVSPKPIMVSFGTNQGPIVPRPITTTQIPQIQRAPAPVSESSDDVPNPSIYRPLIPQQYRNRVLSFRPNPNLILGTAQDQKYLASSEKFNLLKQQQARAIGLDYRGPQFFEAQAYELEKQRQRFQQPTAKSLFQPIMKPYEVRRYQKEPNEGAVPEIGVVFSSGLRYYIPQFGLYGDHRDSQENSVFGQNDASYYYNKNY